MRALFVVFALALSTAALAQSADQAITSATDSPDPVVPGNNVTYTVTVMNNGPDPAVNGGLNIVLSGSVTPISRTAPAGFTCSPVSQFMSCTTPSFATGTSATFTIVVQPPASLLNFPDGSFTSNFSTSGTTTDPNSGNNSANVTTNYDSPQIDLALTVADAPDPVTPNNNITYTVPVTNNGPDTATNVNFNVFNNGSLRFQSSNTPAGWNCTLPAVNSTPTFTCTNPSFASGATSTFTVVVRADFAILGANDGTVSTAFNVNGTGNESTQANNSETENTAYITPDADMTVAVTDSPDPVAPDGNITYTVLVTNNGPDAAPSAQLSSFNNGSLRFVSLSSPAGWSCTPPAAGAAPNISCTNPSFANGGSASFTVVAKADSTILGINDGTVSTNFTASSGAADPNNANSSETEDTAYVTPDAELAITNADAPDPVTPGGTITYTQTVTNNGPNAANTTVSQILPGSVGFQSINNPGGFTCATPAIGASGTITCTNASFASGASATFTLVVSVLASSGTVIDTVQVSSPLQDTVSTNNSAQVTTTILAAVIADLSITKSTGATNAAPGSLLSYTITLTNNGPDPASSVVVTDALPAELLFQSIAKPASFNCTTPAVGATGTITCTTATMASGTTATFTLVVQVTGNATGPINNNATASSSTQDNNSGNSTGGAGAVTVGGSGTADIGVTKTTPTTAAAAGSTVVYTITATNNGPNAAANVVVTDTLPSTLLFQSITPAATFTCVTPAVGSSGTITCTGGPLANGTSAVFTLTTMISPSATGSIANTASAGSNASDTSGGNNASTTAAILVGSADLSIVKSTAATQATTGSTLTYTISVTNNGPDPATNVVVNDDLPAGLQFVSAIPTQGSCSGTDPFSCSLGTLNSGATATITLQALVTATTGSIANTATVSSAIADGNGANNSSTTPATPVTNAAPSEAEIPTLSQWALLFMCALLAIAAFVRMR
jgi:uncharacterized repeat protein (TIGR01451 family)